MFDSSALLAITFNENGAARAEAVLKCGILSTVNASEVVARFVEVGAKESQARQWLLRFGLDIRPFDQELAITTGLLRATTRHFGLSLGDRACIALAQQLDRPVITADQRWSTLDLGVDVQQIR